MNIEFQSWKFSKKIFRFMIQFKESFKKVNDTKKGYHKFFLSDFFFQMPYS